MVRKPLVTTRHLRGPGKPADLNAGSQILSEPLALGMSIRGSVSGNKTHTNKMYVNCLKIIIHILNQLNSFQYLK